MILIMDRDRGLVPCLMHLLLHPERSQYTFHVQQRRIECGVTQRRRDHSQQFRLCDVPDRIQCTQSTSVALKGSAMHGGEPRVSL